MVRHIVFADEKIQHSKDVDSPPNRFNTIPIKTIFLQVQAKLFQIYLEKQRNQNRRNNFLKRENKVGGIHPPDFYTYYMVTVIKTMWC